MAISNYSDLQAEVSKWIHRSDLTAMIPSFITLAENRLNRSLRLTAMESIDELTSSTTSRFIALPARFSEPLNMNILLSNVQMPVAAITTSQMAKTIASVPAMPRYYTIGSQIELNSVSDQPYTIFFHCIKNFDLESDGVNWLITNAPEAYLYGALREAYVYIHDEQQASKYDLLVKNALTDIAQQDGRSRSVSKLVTDPAMFQSATLFNINRGY
jgi:hypothetical protein